MKNDVVDERPLRTHTAFRQTTMAFPCGRVVFGLRRIGCVLYHTRLIKLPLRQGTARLARHSSPTRRLLERLSCPASHEHPHSLDFRIGHPHGPFGGARSPVSLYGYLGLYQSRLAAGPLRPQSIRTYHCPNTRLGAGSDDHGSLGQ